MIRRLLSLLFGAQRPPLAFRALSETAQVPTYASEGAAGLDLYADEDVTIGYLQRGLVKTNVAVDLPAGFEAQVRARSGLALKRGIAVLNGPGTIDPDYTGGIGVILYNTEFEDFVVKRGDRIAQFVIARFERVEPVFLAEEDQTGFVRITARGAGGFGPTGVSPAALTANSISTASIPVGSITAAKLHSPPAAWVEGDPALMHHRV